MIFKQNPKGLLKYVAPLVVPRIFFLVVFEHFSSLFAISLIYRNHFGCAISFMLSEFAHSCLFQLNHIFWAKSHILSQLAHLCPRAHLCPHAHLCQLAHVELISSYWAYIKPTHFSVNSIVLSLHEPGDKVVSICAIFEDFLGSLHIFLNKLAHLWANVLDYKILAITFLPTCSNTH